jgi:hypothetical protein
MPGTDLYNPLSIYDSGCTLYILVLLMTNGDESQPIAKLSRKETGPNILMSNEDYIRVSVSAPHPLDTQGPA